VPRVGVLALQGDVGEHVAALERVGAQVVKVRRAEQLDGLDGLVMPGGESTTIAHLLDTSGLRAPLKAKLDGGLKTFGTCAGLILLSTEILDGRRDQWSFAKLDVAVRRNGYGRQIASFERVVSVKDVGEVPGVFIRAPKIESLASEVQVLATITDDGGEHAVLVRQGNVWGCSFHPELTSDLRIHQLFTDEL
jgi:5'-phosphate synthase pdxT subunit